MGKRILIVDDNRELLALMCASLRRAGFTTSTATTGTAALQKARSRVPDAIVLDLLLPELDGFAVCEALKQQPETARVPVIIMTGLGTQFARLHGLAAGAVDFLIKPLSPQQLIDRIGEVLSRTEAVPLPS